MRSGLGGHETLNLYAEAIAGMPENPGMPPLFRDIFKNAYLPYRDPETLRALPQDHRRVLYDHSGHPGRRLRVPALGARLQGDAEQFRTPHLHIGFIVAILDQKARDRARPGVRYCRLPDLVWKHILGSQHRATATAR